MGQIAQKEQLIRDLIQLRAAGDQSPAADGIAAVRANLGRMIGPTVTRAMAARLLGISQPAIDRWIDTGDIPLVINRSDRRELPLRALIDLIEAVDQRRVAGALRPVASVLHENHSRARALDLDKILPERHHLEGEDRGHRRADLLGLGYHRAIAPRINDRIVREARRRVSQWRDEQRMDPRYADKWDELLAKPIQQIATVISRDDQEGRELRQNSPLAGLLSEAERRRILEAVANVAP